MAPAGKTRESENSQLPLRRSVNVFTDIRDYFLHIPEIPTLVVCRNNKDRCFYSESILQRVGIDVEQYHLLNLHRIAIEVPATMLFDELMQWNGDSICWPNHIARVNLVNGRLDRILISLLGKSKDISGKGGGWLSLGFPQLFVLDAIRIQTTPGPLDPDNARYLLYRCSGGYPIGIFSMYIRTSIPDRGETAMSQLFILVSFNFFGKRFLSRLPVISRIWEWIHNRVTANVANRFKKLMEWKFGQLTGNDDAPHHSGKTGKEFVDSGVTLSG
mgnify:CR=1 FL=1